LKDLRFQLMFRGVLYKILCHSTGIIHMICQRIMPIFPVFDFEQLRNKIQKAFMLWGLL
jgi:hypothetical protein